MNYVSQHMVRKTVHPQLYQYLSENAQLAKNLHNAALFRVRQIFTGWDKTDEERCATQTEVFGEVALLEKTCPSVHVRRNMSYLHLEKLLRVTDNPDFFSALPMQSAQGVVKQVVQDWKNWLKQLKDYKKSPEKYAGKPKMPGYIKGEKTTFTITNQDAVLYPVYENGSYRGMELKLPRIKERLFLSNLPDTADLREVKVVPFYGTFLLSLTIQSKEPPFYPDMPFMAGIDFGQDNTATLVCNDRTAVVYKGGAILAENQMFVKRRASAVSVITKGHEHMRASSHHLDRLSIHHECFIKDMLHKLSHQIIQYCVDHRAGILVLGVNKGWKQNIHIGKKNNQNFVSIPFYRLRHMIWYKAMRAGITVIEQEESYTSKADITAMDRIPVYGKEPDGFHFSGRRIKRGLYRTSAGYCINADCNGGANILRKAIPDAWKQVTDFRFLAYPVRVDFHDLNRKPA